MEIRRQSLELQLGIIQMFEITYFHKITTFLENNFFGKNAKILEKMQKILEKMQKVLEKMQKILEKMQKVLEKMQNISVQKH